MKHALNTSNGEFERRLVDQKSKSEKNQKLLIQQLNECTTRITTLEKEISIYKDKIIRMKSATKPGAGTESSLAQPNANNLESSSFLNENSSTKNKSISSSALNDGTGGGGGSFFLKNQSSNLADSNLIDAENHASGKLSNGLSNNNPSSKVVKVSRKDLRRLTEDELVQRSLKNQDNH